MERVANDISGKYHGRPNVTFFFLLFFLQREYRLAERL